MSWCGAYSFVVPPARQTSLEFVCWWSMSQLKEKKKIAEARRKVETPKRPESRWKLALIPPGQIVQPAMENQGQAANGWGQPVTKAVGDGAQRRAGPGGDSAVLRPLSNSSRAGLKFPSISSNELRELWKQQSSGARLPEVGQGRCSHAGQRPQLCFGGALGGLRGGKIRRGAFS